jgi:regulator of protease activity HflC (stomatin/prohibitin superfamily)
MTDEHHNWQNLYPPAESHWQDLTRIGKFFIPIVFILFFLAAYGTGYVFFYFDTLFPASSVQQPEYLIFVQLLPRMLSLIAIMLIGFIFVSWQMRKFVTIFYQPKSDEKLTPLIRRKLFGIPPMPPGLSTMINYPFVVIREPSFEENHWARWFGGPATLVVYDGIAVYVERGNVFSRVVGPGLPFLERNERIRDVVDLRPQNMTKAIQLWTKDGIPIKLKIRAEVQIYADQNAIKNSERLRYPFDPVAVKKAVEYSAVRLIEGNLVEISWLEGAWGTITGLINQFVAGHSLDELFLAPEVESHHPGFNHQENHTMESIEQLFSGKISKRVTNNIQANLQKNGVNLLGLQITDIEMPKEIRELRERYWESIKQKVSAKRNSHAEAERIRAREQAHAEAQRTMLLAITKKLEHVDPEDLTESLILSLSGILDQGLDDPIVRPLIAKESFALLERMRKMIQERF